MRTFSRKPGHGLPRYVGQLANGNGVASAGSRQKAGAWAVLGYSGQEPSELRPFG
ncbi:hypothetical protein LC612_28240 [Nostoc sp. CHAB 5834]|nr:hypothetical protein [Nostoc sp. CHAB 5834]